MSPTYEVKTTDKFTVRMGENWCGYDYRDNWGSTYAKVIFIYDASSLTDAPTIAPTSRPTMKGTLSPTTRMPSEPPTYLPTKMVTIPTLAPTTENPTQASNESSTASNELSTASFKYALRQIANLLIFS